MTDREKVIYDIERCICHVPDACRDCSHYGQGEEAIRCMENLMADVLSVLKEQETVVRCGDCENFCFDNISPNAGRCMLTNMSHSKTWFCAHGKREEN